MRWLVAVACLLIAVPAGSGSQIEDAVGDVAPGVHYQEDGGVPGDAPATCAEATPDRGVNLDGAGTNGLLVEVDDESDAYGFVITDASVGDRIAVNLATDLLTTRYDVAFDVFAPGCLESVFDPEATYYTQTPEEPYEPNLGENAREGTVTGYDCDPAGWKMLANQMHGMPAPADIYVEWTNGEFEYVPVDKSTPATIAMYRTSSNLDVLVERIVIVVPATYTGQFKIASGPCDAVQGTPPTPPAHVPSSYGEFTVQQAGTHVAVVYISRGTVDKTVDTLEEAIALIQDIIADPPTSIGVNCHQDLCSAALGSTDYNVDSLTLPS